jgi:hypothetical protein
MRFNDAVCILDYIASNDRLDELEWIWKKAVVAYLRYYPAVCLKRLRKTTKTSVRIAGLQTEI